MAPAPSSAASAPKRFWTQAACRPAEGGAGWAVRLDGKPLRTPGGAELLAPTQALGEATAAEWNAQGERLDPATLPLTKALNTVIDRVTTHHAEVVGMIAEYGGSDLICYRAPHPRPLAERQAEAWDPWLAWAETRHGARLTCAEGVMHVAQPAEALAALTAAVAAHDPHRLAALHELVTLSGSLVLGLAVSEGALGAEDGWRLSRLDEDFQAEHWGEDAEAAEVAALKRRDFLQARRLLDLLA
ncbi:MAG: ATP12 family protein [Pseudomonadota bacterium]|nr:ATP12 family protein [Pseudomonadota bacterium]MEE3101692.1 ATP12 family protein [Pseudomonadota bacterium]